MYKKKNVATSPLQPRVEFTGFDDDDDDDVVVVFVVVVVVVVVVAVVVVVVVAVAVAVAVAFVVCYCSRWLPDIQSGKTLSMEELFDILGDGLRGGDGGIALVDGTVLGDQELFKVPLDAAHHQRLLLRLQVGVDRVLVLAVDINLGHQGERHSKVQLAERLDLYFVEK
jgi:hypothetical protein